MGRIKFKILYGLILLMFAADVCAQVPKLMLPIGHTQYLMAVRLSPDRKQVVTIGADKKTILWDVETGLRLAALFNNERQLDDVHFNHGGSRILGIQKYGNEQSIPLWDAKSGLLIANLTHLAQVYYGTFSSDGEKILTTGLDRYVRIWDAKDGHQIDSIFLNAIGYKAIFSHDGSKIATADSRRALIFDAVSKRVLDTLSSHTESVVDISFSEDDQRVVTSSRDHSAKIWEVKGGRLLFTLKLEEDVEEVKFNAGGGAVITYTLGIGHRGYKLWDAKTGKLLQQLGAEKEKPRFALFSPSGKFVASGTEEKDVKVWDTETGKLIYILKDHYGGARDAIFSADESLLVVGTGSTDTKVWDLKTGGLVHVLKGDANGVLKIEMSKDGKRLITPSGIKAAVWDLEKGTLITELKGSSTEAVSSIKYGSNGRTLITDNGTNTFTRVWDVKNGDMLGNSIYAQPDIDRLVYSKSYERVMVSYKLSPTIEIWNMETGDLISTLDKQRSAYQNRWVFSPDEKFLVTASASDSLINLWDVQSGKIALLLKRNSKVSIDELLFTPDQALLISVDNNQFTECWQVKTGEKHFTIPKIQQGIPQLKWIDKSNWLLATSSRDNKIWDMATGKLVLDIVGHKNSVRHYLVSPDRKRLVTSAFYDDVVKLWDLENRKLIADLQNGKKEPGFLEVTSDWKYIVTSSFFEPIVRVFDCSTGVLVHAIKAHEANATSGLRLAANGIMFTRKSSDEIRKWEISSGRLIQTYSWPKAYFSAFNYNEETNELLVGTSSGTIKLFDAETANVIQTFTGHTGSINALTFGLQKHIFVSAADDHTLKTWNKATGKTISTFLPIGPADFLNQVSLGYYKASPGASKQLHYVTTSLQPISFEQLDVKFNRPDRVLTELGGDTALIAAYHKAYLKRVKKLNIDTAAFANGFAMPVVDFVNRQHLTPVQLQPDLKLHVKGSDSQYNLDRFNVWVNESPVFGIKGISLKAKRTKDLDTTISIRLSEGNNRIEVSIFNTSGIESYRMPLHVSFKPEQSVPQRLYFVGIGIDEFSQSQHNLRWSVKDIRDQAKALSKKYGELITIDTLFNRQVTVDNITAIKSKLKQTRVDDKVIIAYSGHGLLTKDYDYFLSTYDVNFDQPQQNGLPYELLENLLDGIPARKKLLLLDACHSGEVDKDELLKYAAQQQQLEANKVEGAKGIKVSSKKSTMKTSLQLMQELFANVGKSTGATVISAAAGTQFALEKNELQNGVFSFSILEYLRNNSKATVSDLKKYVNKRVIELTSGLQVPTTRAETHAINWNIW